LFAERNELISRLGCHVSFVATFDSPSSRTRDLLEAMGSSSVLQSIATVDEFSMCEGGRATPPPSPSR